MNLVTLGQFIYLLSLLVYISSYCKSIFVSFKDYFYGCYAGGYAVGYAGGYAVG